MADLDLNGIAEQLTAATSETPSPSPSSTVTPEAPTSAATPSAEPVSTPDDDAIPVTFSDGTVETIKRSELPNYVLRQKDLIVGLAQ